MTLHQKVNERPQTREVEVVNFNMPFFAMVGLIVKFELAAIVASSVFIVFGIIGLIFLRYFLGYF